jgi:hypothetical protein
MGHSESIQAEKHIIQEKMCELEGCGVRYFSHEFTEGWRHLGRTWMKFEMSKTWTLTYGIRECAENRMLSVGVELRTNSNCNPLQA